ncbi:hypothetical protein [Candidatus Hecatella orcuttiae]|jgi:tetratricopeptide (TPR) repeat protein|uniref:hypothetical protein n=1 Tax=Candidatus Hecatella orcuttiae TaxID=1935119 RepID=UPI002867F9EC|nr:hypothetical protein [Candidatus Hecatella orcuttiae]
MSQSLISDAPGMRDLVGTYAWVTGRHSAALRKLASKIVKYYVSYVKVEDGKVVSISPENAHTPTVENMLYRIHAGWSKDPEEKVGRFVDSKITLAELQEIREAADAALRVIEENKWPAGNMARCLEPFLGVIRELFELIRKKDVTSNKVIKKYEEAVRKFHKELVETPWDKLPKADPPTIKETLADFAKILGEVQKGVEFWTFYLPGLPTDFDRIASTFYVSVREIDDAFRGYEELVRSCKEKSGFMKGPPPDLTQSAMQAMRRLWDLLCGLGIPTVLSSNYLKKPIFKKEALREIDKAIEKASKQGYVDGKDASRVLHFLGFGSRMSIVRWMNR